MPPGLKSTNNDDRKRESHSATKSVEQLLPDGRMYIEKGVTKQMAPYEFAKVTVGFEFAFTDETYRSQKAKANAMIDREITIQLDNY